MPGSMNGIGLAQAVRERWPGIGLLVTSGRVRPGPEDLPSDVAFLAKPYLLDTVIRQMATPQVIGAVPNAAQSR